MAFKRTYNTQAEIPEAQREHYVERNGVWEPDVEGVGAIGIVVTERATALAEVARLNGEKATLTTERDTARSSTLPRGHVAIPSADAQLLEALRPLGTPEEITAIKSQRDTLKAKDDARTKQEHLDTVAEVMGWDKEVTRHLPGLPETEVRPVMENGQAVLDDKGKPKRTVVAKIKQADNSIVEKPLADVVNETPALKVFERSLKVTAPEQDGTPYFDQSGTGGGGDAAAGLSASLIKNRYGHNAPQAAGAAS